MLKWIKGTGDVVDEIPVNLGKNAEIGEDMNVEEGGTTAADYNVEDIEKYYVETVEYGQTQQSQPGVNIGFDGEIRIPMVSQYGSTPQASQSDEVHAGMLEVFLNQFDECVKRINDTFKEGFELYPESEKIKKKHTMWKEMLKKVVSTDTTSGQAHTSTDKTP
ncbi:hypothetical protein Hanom_Chr04g00321641 [Helianthus anomalus]